MDFSVDPEFQDKLDWMRAFVHDEVEPLDLVFPNGGDMYDMENKAAREIIKPLRDRVKQQGLWACHLTPELGGKGYGQLKLALMNEILGRTSWGPTVFGCAAPDTGNAEILALYGTVEQKKRYLLQGMAGRRRMGDRGREMVCLQCQSRGLPHRHGRDQPRECAA